MQNKGETVQTEVNQNSPSETPGNPPSKPEFAETVLNLVVAIFFYSILSYAFMYISHLNQYVEWAVVVVGAGVVIVLYLPLKSETAYAFKLLGPYVVVLLAVFAAVLATVAIVPNTPNQVFREFIIIYFSFLPAWLYLQFVATKGKTIWDEYVYALFRLQVDNYAHLPRPPEDSYYYKIWNEAREKLRKPKQPLELNPYQKKFEARFGPVGGND